MSGERLLRPEGRGWGGMEKGAGRRGPWGWPGMGGGGGEGPLRSRESPGEVWARGPRWESVA